MSPTEDRVRKIISDYSGKKAEVINLEETFEELQMDSLDTIEAVMAFEDEFECNVTDDEEEAFRKPADMIAYAVAHKLED